MVYAMKVVLDTEVILSGLRSPTGASRILVIAALERMVVPLAAVNMMIEYEGELKRPENLSAMGLDANDIDAFLSNWAAAVEPVRLDFLYRLSLRYPNDELFVEAALNGGADALVTLNVGDYQPSDPAVEHIGVDVCRPGEFLRRMQWRPSLNTLSAFRPRL